MTWRSAPGSGSLNSHVERDDAGPAAGQTADEIRQGGARPRPAPDSLEARLVDGDDGDRGRDRAGPPDLEVLIVEVELQSQEEIRGGPVHGADEHDDAQRDEQGNTAACARAALGHQSAALKYFAAGWWKTSAETDASGSIMNPSVRAMPTSSGRSRRQSVAWSARSGQAG